MQKKLYEHVCPVCKRHVSSNAKTGQVNHRNVCGNQFCVKNGIVTEARRKPGPPKKTRNELLRVGVPVAISLAVFFFGSAFSRGTRWTRWTRHHACAVGSCISCKPCRGFGVAKRHA